ncbi:MAG: sulfite exporter TauE/SafE family protein [Caldimonas sp.]
MELIATLVSCGLVSGFLAGLLGIGGGFVVVPAMYLVLPPSVAPAAWLPQMAIATSLAAMIPTTATALFAQARRGAVDTDWLRRLAPGVCIGAVAGAVVAPHCDAGWVAVLFTAYASYFAVRLLLAPRGIRLPTPWTRWPCWIVATAVGGVSVLAGVGGAVLTVPYLESRQIPMTSATATSSGVGLMLSLVAVAIFAIEGTLRSGTPHPPLVWWPAASIIGVSAMVTAPWGVRVAHRLPVDALKRLFALLLLVAAFSALSKIR